MAIVTIDGQQYERTDFPDGSYELKLVTPPPPDPGTIVITITPDAPQPAGTTLSAHVEVRDSNDQLVPVTATYYVPIVRLADSWQADLLTVDLAGGAADVTFTLPQKGIYTLRTDLIRPTPRASLPTPPEVIAT